MLCQQQSIETEKGDDFSRRKPKLEYKPTLSNIKTGILQKKIVGDSLHSNLELFQQQHQNEPSAEEKLNTIIHLRETCMIYRSFLKEQKCEENLIFWVEVELYKVEKDGVDFNDKALRIYDRFFADNAPCLLNVDVDVKRALKQAIDDGASVNTFENAQKVIFRLMETSCLPKFLTSEIYQSYLEKKNVGQAAANKPTKKSKHFNALQKKSRLISIISYKTTGLQLSSDRLEIERWFYLREHNRELLNSTL